MTIIYRMKPSSASKKTSRCELDQSRVWRKFAISLVLITQSSYGSQNIKFNSGISVSKSNSKTTYFFSGIKTKPSSYAVTYLNGEIFILIKRGADSFQLRVKNNKVVYAVVEKRVRAFRVVASFYLKDKSYILKQAIVTNRFLFSSNGTCPIPQLSAMQSSLDSIQATVDNATRDSFGSDAPILSPAGSTCVTLNATESRKLLNLKSVFEVGTGSNKSVSNCLKDVSLFKKVVDYEKENKNFSLDAEQVKKNIALVQKFFEANQAKDTISIGCKKNLDPKNTSVAQYNALTNGIEFYLGSNETTLMSKERTDIPFLHEVVHASLSQPNECTASNEEGFADAVSKICTDYPKASTGGGGDDGGYNLIGKIQIDNPAAAAPNLPESAELSRKTEIVLATVSSELPVQKIDQASVSFSESMIAKESAPEANAVFQEAAAPAMRSFSRALDGISSALIPHAEAQVAQLEATNPMIVPVVEQAVYAEPTVKNPDRFIEQDSPRITAAIVSQVAVQKTSETLRAPASETVVAKKEIQARGLAATNGGSSSSTLPFAPAFAGSSYDRELKQQLQRSGAQAQRPFNRVVDGVTFSSQNLSGPAYQKYSYRIEKDQEFVNDVAENKILISRNGAVITKKTKKIDAFFVDTGQALIYRNGNSQ